MFGIGIALFCQGVWTAADLRRGIETVNPADYFQNSYYERWLESLISFFLDTGYFTENDLIQKIPQVLNPSGYPMPKGADPSKTATILEILRKGKSVQEKTNDKPLFQAGEKIRVKNVPLTDHTRLPGFLRSKIGVIDTVYDGVYFYFNTGVDGLGKHQPAYRVRFDLKDLWTESSRENDLVYADLYECYLEQLDRS